MDDKLSFLLAGNLFCWLRVVWFLVREEAFVPVLTIFEDIVFWFRTEDPVPVLTVYKNVVSRLRLIFFVKA